MIHDQYIKEQRLVCNNSFYYCDSNICINITRSSMSGNSSCIFISVSNRIVDEDQRDQFMESLDNIFSWLEFFSEFVFYRMGWVANPMPNPPFSGLGTDGVKPFIRMKYNLMIHLKPLKRSFTVVKNTKVKCIKTRLFPYLPYWF